MTNFHQLKTSPWPNFWWSSQHGTSKQNCFVTWHLTDPNPMKLYDGDDDDNVWIIKRCIALVLLSIYGLLGLRSPKDLKYYMTIAADLLLKGRWKLGTKASRLAIYDHYLVESLGYPMTCFWLGFFFLYSH